MWRRLAVWALRVAYLGVLAALFVISAYVAFSLFVRRGVTPVPTVVGLDLDEAEQVLADSGLQLRHREEDDRFAAEIPPGRVLEQRPGGGGLAKRGGAVEIVLSRGQQRIAAPEVVGTAATAAQVTLAAAGLTAGRLARIYATAAAVGTVVAQDPAPGTEIERGAAVDLYVAAESLVDTYVMPDLVDRDYHAVRSFLEGRGFRIGSVKFEPYEGIRRRLVLRQFPLPGHPVGRDDVISLVVAAGAEEGVPG
jgi:eukaryotic-like serine/threonine-protein kinase